MVSGGFVFVPCVVVVVVVVSSWTAHSSSFLIDPAVSPESAAEKALGPLAENAPPYGHLALNRLKWTALASLGRKAAL